MQAKKLTLLQTVAAIGVFSAVSCWYDDNLMRIYSLEFPPLQILDLTHFLCFRYGFMFGRESARRELGGIIDDLRNNRRTTNSTVSSEPDAHSKP
jgi:hypothetical protein